MMGIVVFIYARLSYIRAQNFTIHLGKQYAPELAIAPNHSKRKLLLQEQLPSKLLLASMSGNDVSNSLTDIRSMVSHAF
jgi:hypothetical protein